MSDTDSSKYTRVEHINADPAVTNMTNALCDQKNKMSMKMVEIDFVNRQKKTRAAGIFKAAEDKLEASKAEPRELKTAKNNSKAPKVIEEKPEVSAVGLDTKRAETTSGASTQLIRVQYENNKHCTPEMSQKYSHSTAKMGSKFDMWRLN
jgi:hypothetical protein